MLTAIHAESIERATNDVVTHTRKILHSATTDQDDGVLLKIMTFTTNVGDHFITIGEANLSDFSERRVRLLWRPSVNLETNAATLRAVVQSRGFRLRDCFLTSFADELVNGGHNAIVLGWRLSGFVQ